jgi:hypothetical protein
MTRLPLLFGAVAALAASAAAAVVTGLSSRASRYEEPAFEVVRSLPTFEVRRYAPTVEAQVTMPGSYNQAVRGAFGVLAGYIFGGNAPRTSIAMTTPVSAQPAGQTIAMTTPVSAAAGPAGWTVSFTMPSGWTLDTLPAANDDRVRLVAQPGVTWAVRGFGGRATDGVVTAELATLRRDAEAASLVLGETSIVSQFDPPWVLGPFRRNEVRWMVVGGA